LWPKKKLEGKGKGAQPSVKKSRRRGKDRAVDGGKKHKQNYLRDTISRRKHGAGIGGNGKTCTQGGNSSGSKIIGGGGGGDLPLIGQRNKGGYI